MTCFFVFTKSIPSDTVFINDVVIVFKATIRYFILTQPTPYLFNWVKLW